MVSGSSVAAPTRELTHQPDQARRGFRSRALHSEPLLFALFVAPNLLIFAIFTYWPMIYSAYLSVVSWDLLAATKPYVGYENYRYLLGDDTFRLVLRNTLVFTLGSVGGSLALGLGAALLLNQPLRGRDGARAVVFAPTLLSGAAISIVWVYIFDPRFGLMAKLLSFVNVSSPTWLRDTTWSMVAIIIVYVWKNLGFAAVIYLARLQTIQGPL